jgi:hypothetical protein
MLLCAQIRVRAAEDAEAGTALLSMCEAACATAAAAVADAKRCVRKADNAQEMRCVLLLKQHHQQNCMKTLLTLIMRTVCSQHVAA